jgi:sulfatase maturation enzyme AslB (radical SAM superfamily)
VYFEIDCTKCAFYPVCHGGCRMELVFNNKAFNCTSLKRDVVSRLKYKMEIIKKEKAKKSL